ncbi:MAG TPA: hypothetical protein VNF93_02250 [Buchnera sp. (in: enterobacteria)]|nr:hypothetical protein [Buchnera sp. (in: enterobacteria)]
MNVSNYEIEPLTEEEALGLLENGNYKAKINDIEIKSSKSGTKYPVVNLDVFDKNNNIKKFNDWLSLPHKIKHICDSLGFEEDYKNRNFPISKINGKFITVKISISKPTDKYPIPRNNIIDYLPIENNYDLNDDLIF